MTSVFYAIFSSFLCLTMLSILVLSYFRSIKKEFSLTFQLSSIGVFIWSFFSVFDFLLLNSVHSIDVRSLKLIGITLFYTFLYLHIKNHIEIKPFTYSENLLLFIIPILTCLAAITNKIFHLIIIDQKVFFNDNKVLAVLPKYSIWFYVHSAYCYLLILLTLFSVLRMFFVTPLRSKKPMIMILLAIGASVIINILITLELLSSPFDIRILAAVGMLLVCYLYMPQIKSANIIMMSRNHIYNNILNMIFVLDTEKIILDCNKKAKELFASLGLKPFGLKYEHFLEIWIAKSKAIISPYDISILTIIEDSQEKHMHIIMQDVIVSSEHIGHLVIVQEITQIYTLLRYSQESALYDPLTGIYNRNMYMQQLKTLNTQTYMPIGIIIGDVNNLKTVNDTFGHLIGDELLKDIAKILDECSPSRAIISRIGGDEFAIIIPNSTQNECDGIISKIQHQSSFHHNENYDTTSIALGTALVADENQDILQIIKQADEDMYKHKNNRRRISDISQAQ